MPKKAKTRAEIERERGKLKSWKLKENKLNRAARQVNDDMLKTHTAGERKLKEEKKFLLEVYRDYSTVLDSFNPGRNDRGSIENQIGEVYPQERITKNANAGVNVQASLNKLTAKKREIYDKSRRLLESMKNLAEKEVDINALLGLRTGYSDEQQYAAAVRDRSRELLAAFDEFDDMDKAVLNELEGFREMYSFAVNMQRHYALNMGGALNKDDYKSAVHLKRINVNPKTDIIDSIVNVRSRVIFSHEPSPTDIHQGAIGNCYMLSVLAGLAANNPEKIKEMITDNEDGTATVRFFDKKNKPVLVTVDKSVPRFGGIG